MRYRSEPDASMETYKVAPFDVKSGNNPATQSSGYLWSHSYDHESTVSLRLGRVLGLSLSDATFSPDELMAGWRKQPTWNVPRDW